MIDVHGEPPEKSRRPRWLFLCTGNACRSQMAEGWARSIHGDRFDVRSAGIVAHGLDPRAVIVMRECGIDISSQRSERLDGLDGPSFDLVVTVCSRAAASCPVFPGDARVIHAPFDDPPALARDATTEQEALGHYRRVRDEIRSYVETLPDPPASK